MSVEMQRRKPPAGVVFVLLFWSSQMTTTLLVAAGGTAASASSFPAPLPEYGARNSSERTRHRHHHHWITEGSGGASSDDEGTDNEEEDMSSEEFEDPPAEENTNINLLWLPHHHQQQQNGSSTETRKMFNAKGETKEPSEALLAEELDNTAGTSTDSSSPPLKTSLVNSNDNNIKPETKQNKAISEADSPPLQTIHKLRRMLDDTDYMTSTASYSRMPRQQSERAASRARPVSSAENGSIQRTTESILSKNDPISDNEEKEKEGASTTATREIENSTVAHLVEPLWTSKDRSKYKKVQKRAMHKSPPIFLNSDDEASDTDDGLGYVLPNVPVYFSDGEEESEDSDYVAAEDDIGDQQNESFFSVSTSNRALSPADSTPVEPLQKDSPPPAASACVPSAENLAAQPYPQENAPPVHVPPNNMYPYPQKDPQSSQQETVIRPYNPYLYGYPYTSYQPPYAPYVPPQQQQYPYPNPYSQQWGAAGYSMPHPPPQQPYESSPANHPLPQLKRQPAQVLPRSPPSRLNQSGQVSMKPPTSNTRRDESISATAAVRLPPSLYAVETTGLDLSSMAYPGTIGAGHDSLAEASSKLSFDAIQKIGLMLVTVALACYAGVSPRTLPLTEYNLKFYENFQLVSLAFISPVIKFISVFDAQQNDVNDAVNTFFASFSLGYPLAFLLEIVVTTLVRLAVFAWFEPSIFSLTPQIPLLVIPWTLRENRYRPKRITLLAADFCASCMASPVIEEYVKLKTLQWTTNLRKNFRWVKKSSTSKNSKKRHNRWVAEPLPRQIGETDVLSANQYVTQMLAASIGFKLCDAGRRILMYTKPSDANKSFYAFCRGLFPIHELCGTLTAIGLAKRDLLGVNIPLWRLLIPGAVIHGMANMRGKKPVFRWGSATPWSEMQLSPLHILDGSTLPQLLSKGFAKLMWLVLLSRVLASCIKQYYYVNRSAKKRTTRYAGNHAAFSAELATAEMLKKK